jgi:copper homeostasis protein
VFGFLRPDGRIDLDAITPLAGRVVQSGRVWTFHRAIDHAVDRDRAFGELDALPGLSAVLTAGSGAGVTEGYVDLIRRAGTAWASRLLVGGGLRPQHVAGLVRAGVRSFHIGSGARVTGRWSEPVSAAEVGRWRQLLDRELAQTDGR